MLNSSLLQNNVTQLSISVYTSYDYIRMSFIFVLGVCFCLFIYLSAVMILVFFANPHLQESARYVLFYYMLVNDMSYLLLSCYLMLTSTYSLYIPVSLCYALYTSSAMMLRITPYNLSAMALEQYTAICHPLRYQVLCTPQRASLAFTLICTWLVIPYVAELGIMVTSHTNIFNLYVLCKQEMLLVNPIQNVLRSANLIFCFTFVAIVIFFTYVKIMIVARRAGSQSSSASKARRTVMLHAFQLLLCMAALLSTLAEAFQEAISWAKLTPFFTFFFFTCVPRFISPLIYGLRDELLRKHIRKYLPKTLHKRMK
ncbi:odorant receptor 131-2-like [Gastrophryne carolinensis]